MDHTTHPCTHPVRPTEALLADERMEAAVKVVKVVKAAQTRLLGIVDFHIPKRLAIPLRNERDRVARCLLGGQVRLVLRPREVLAPARAHSVRGVPAV